MTTQTEAAFQAQVIELARLHGWRHYHTRDSRRSVPGFPDLVLLRGKTLAFVELKTDTGRLPLEQLDWLAALSAVTGVHAAVWRPLHWDEIQAFLAHRERFGAVI